MPGRVTWSDSGLQTFSAERQAIGISGFVGYVILATDSAVAPEDNMSSNMGPAVFQ